MHEGKGQLGVDGSAGPPSRHCLGHHQWLCHAKKEGKGLTGRQPHFNKAIGVELEHELEHPLTLQPSAHDFSGRA
jgi:hypothetical protein